jgi:hypothetical protein
MEDKIEELETIVRLLQLQRDALTQSLDKTTRERNLYFKQKKENIEALEVVRRRVQMLENPATIYLVPRLPVTLIPRDRPWRVYLSSRWGRREELLEYRKRLLGYEFRVTSRWLDASESLEGQLVYSGNDARRIATSDLEDILMSDIIIGFSEQENSQFARGGRHVEIGYALAHPEKVVAIVGDQENVFHSLVPQFNTFDECLKYMMGGY